MFKKFTKRETENLSDNLVPVQRKCSEFKTSISELETGESIQINISDWKKDHKTPPGNLWTLKPKKFSRMMDKQQIYWYIIREK